MYLQITTRCNMQCRHCCFACTTEGEDMEASVYNKAINLMDYGFSVTVGGGEPTIHKDFWIILTRILEKGAEIWMATNGLVKNRALLLAKMASGGVLSVRLSLTQYHAEIDEEVKQAFKVYPAGHHLRGPHELRAITGQQDFVTNEGRAAENGIGNNDQCACDTVVVKPNGDLTQCGCMGAPIIGHVHDINEWNPGWDDCVCYKNRTLEEVMKVHND